MQICATCAFAVRVRIRIRVRVRVMSPGRALHLDSCGQSCVAFDVLQTGKKATATSTTATTMPCCTCCWRWPVVTRDVAAAAAAAALACNLLHFALHCCFCLKLKLSWPSVFCNYDNLQGKSKTTATATRKQRAVSILATKTRDKVNCQHLLLLFFYVHYKSI